MKILKDFGPGHWRENAEKSVVRPSYSYMGKYNISEKVMTDIVSCVSEDVGGIHQIDMVHVAEKREMRNEGIELEVVIDMDYGWDLPARALQFQSRIAAEIEKMTAFNVNKVDIEVREVV